MTDQIRIEHEQRGPAGGWGSLKSVGSVLTGQHALLKATPILPHQNKPDGYACVSCAWAKPEPPHAAEFCENGAKATAWEITPKRTTPEFSASTAFVSSKPAKGSCVPAAKSIPVRLQRVAGSNGAAHNRAATHP